MVDVGDTDTVNGEVVALAVTLPAPLLYTTVHGDAPVSVIDRFVLCPSHMMALPLKVAVGSGFTVTVAVPDTVPVQVAFDTDTNE